MNNLQVYKLIKSKLNISILIYLLFNFILFNFVSLDVSSENLIGSAHIGFHITITSILSSIILIIISIYAINKKYWALNLFIFRLSLETVFSLMVIQTNNFSLYNILLILNILISIIVFYFWRKEIT